MVVCSRTEDYERLNERLNLSLAVCLQPLSETEIARYLADKKRELQAVQFTLRTDPALRELSKLPLMLNIMTSAYRGLPLDALQPLNSVEARRHHLLTQYVKRNLESPMNRANQHKHLKWLSNLAKNMHREKNTIFYIEQIQSTWINADRYYMALVGLFTGLILGLFEGLTLGAMMIIISAFVGLSEGVTLGVITRVFWRSGLFGLVGGCSAALSNGLSGSISGFVVGGMKNNWLRFVFSILIFILVDRMVGSQIGTIITGFILNGDFTFSMSGGLLGGLLLGLALWNKEIKQVERLVFGRPSWQQLKINLRRGGLLGLMVGIIIGVYNSLTMSAGIITTIFGTIVLALGYSLVGIALGVVFSIMQSRKFEEHLQPNQGIRSSFTNAYRLAIVGGIIGVGLGWLQDPSIGYGWFLMAGIELGTLGLFFYFGGSSVIKHYTLRLWLAVKQILPWNLALFLNHMSDLIILRRVGGGYVFIHDILLEYFANDEAGVSS